MDDDETVDGKHAVCTDVETLTGGTQDFVENHETR